MALSSIELPKPKNWADFERHMRVLLKCELKDPNSELHGRSGQPQCGVDVYGYRNADGTTLVGVQCKKKMSKPVTEKELRTEVEKARGFKPALSEFILATTVPRDQAIQTVARTLTQDLAKATPPLKVFVWGWDDIEERAANHEEAWNSFDPTFSPHAQKTFEKVEAIEHLLESRLSKPQHTATQIAGVVVDPDAEHTPLHGQITAFCALINEGDVAVAMAQLTKLKAEKWSSASRSERYRLLVAMASAKLKSGRFTEAGQLLLDAYAECPERKRARTNQAKGYLLLDDDVSANTIAAELLKNDPDNSDAASTLIQARLGDPHCIDPLADIPITLHNAEEVLIAVTHFQRCRQDLTWIETARQGATQYPKSSWLRMMAAEAVLDELTRNDHDVIAGSPIKVVTQAELETAVNVLRGEAESAVDKGIHLSPQLANNSALGLRFIDDIPAAARILDAAIGQHPDDEGLRVHRAILAFAYRDLRKVLELIPAHTTDPEGVPTRAAALVDSDRSDEALTLMDGFDATAAPDHVKCWLLSARCHAYVKQKRNSLAIETANRAWLAEPNNAHVASILVQTYFFCGDKVTAVQVLERVVNELGITDDLPSRVLLSVEAQRLERHDLVVSLLKGRVATGHVSEALKILIAATINGNFRVTAREVLQSLAPSVQAERWVQRAQTMLALHTGSRDADQKLGVYLKRWPNDTVMLLARLAAWQRLGRDQDITELLSSIDFDALVGPAENRIQLASAACRFGHAAKGLPYAYAVLMDNWDNPKAHLAYHGVLLMNEQLPAVLPHVDTVAENTAVHLKNEEGEYWYRLEDRSYQAFEEERLKLDDALAQMLIGKQAGASVLLQNHIGAKPVIVVEVKSIYLHALHTSFDQFNLRFPHEQGMFKLTFDEAADDPFQEIRDIAKARAESGRTFIQFYASNRFPLAFLAGITGRDTLEAWAGLSGANTPFHVCHGTHPEREAALNLLMNRERTGCVLDAITLSEIHKLGVATVVAGVCGPLHTPQSVFDHLAERAIEAKASVGRSLGILSYQNDQLAMEEFTNELLVDALNQAEAARKWANDQVAVVSAMPRQELTQDARSTIDMIRNAACDPAIAADGSGLLLISDDMGFRQWAATAFNIQTTWLQPVLMIARQEGRLSEEKYFDAINTMALSQHVYTSLESGALLHQARKYDFILNNDLCRLLERLGGAKADLISNSTVMAKFLTLVLDECTDHFKIMRIASHALDSMIRDRHAERRKIYSLMLNQLPNRPKWLLVHTFGWLVGHSMGDPEWNKLVAHYKSLMGMSAST